MSIEPEDLRQEKERQVVAKQQTKASSQLAAKLNVHGARNRNKQNEQTNEQKPEKHGDNAIALLDDKREEYQKSAKKINNKNNKN